MYHLSDRLRNRRKPDVILCNISWIRHVHISVEFINFRKVFVISCAKAIFTLFTTYLRITAASGYRYNVDHTGYIYTMYVFLLSIRVGIFINSAPRGSLIRWEYPITHFSVVSTSSKISIFPKFFSGKWKINFTINLSNYSKSNGIFCWIFWVEISAKGRGKN